MLLLPATAEVIASFVAEAEAAPEELSTIANVMPAPPLPFVPEGVHGRLVLMALVCYAGDPEAGKRVIARFRVLAEPIADLVRPMAYPELFPPEEESQHPTVVGRTMFADRIDAGVAETILDHLQLGSAGCRQAPLGPRQPVPAQPQHPTAARGPAGLMPTPTAPSWPAAAPVTG